MDTAGLFSLVVASMFRQGLLPMTAWCAAALRRWPGNKRLAHWHQAISPKADQTDQVPLPAVCAKVSAAHRSGPEHAFGWWEHRRHFSGTWAAHPVLRAWHLTVESIKQQPLTNVMADLSGRRTQLGFVF